MSTWLKSNFFMIFDTYNILNNNIFLFNRVDQGTFLRCHLKKYIMFVYFQCSAYIHFNTFHKYLFSLIKSVKHFLYTKYVPKSVQESVKLFCDFKIIWRILFTKIDKIFFGWLKLKLLSFSGKFQIFLKKRTTWNKSLQLL